MGSPSGPPRYAFMMTLTRIATVTTMRNGSHACILMQASVDTPVGPIPGRRFGF